MTTCRTCGARYSEFGDGWDGECPECADRTFAVEFPDGLYPTPHDPSWWPGKPDPMNPQGGQ